MNCDRWGGDSLRWFVYWMQNIPGADNGLLYNGFLFVQAIRGKVPWWVSGVKAAVTARSKCCTPIRLAVV
jgi:hypothetical protein